MPGAYGSPIAPNPVTAKKSPASGGVVSQLQCSIREAGLLQSWLVFQDRIKLGNDA